MCFRSASRTLKAPEIEKRYKKPTATTAEVRGQMALAWTKATREAAAQWGHSSDFPGKLIPGLGPRRCHPKQNNKDIFLGTNFHKRDTPLSLCDSARKILEDALQKNERVNRERGTGSTVCSCLSFSCGAAAEWPCLPAVTLPRLGSGEKKETDADPIVGPENRFLPGLPRSQDLWPGLH